MESVERKQLCAECVQILDIFEIRGHRQNFDQSQGDWVSCQKGRSAMRAYYDTRGWKRNICQTFAVHDTKHP